MSLTPEQSEVLEPLNILKFYLDGKDLKNYINHNLRALIFVKEALTDDEKREKLKNK